MPEEPQIRGLSMQRRRWFFRALVFVFLVALPAVIFYTTGYRLSFDNDETTIVTTGGMYIDTESTDVQVYLNEEEYVRPRLFQSAYYLQNIEAGKHRVVVQAEGVHTWVKELPVDPHIVIEAAAFNAPTVPQLRPITQYQTGAGAAVYFGVATSTIFSDATSTESLVISSTTATSTYTVNPEYEFVAALFASSSTSTVSVFADNAPEPRFQFAKPVAPGATNTASTTVSEIERSNIRLTDRGWEVYAQWRGDERNIPYYFCVSSTTKAMTGERYGSHVAEAIFSMLGTTTATSTVFDLDGRTCRSEIKLDHLQQDVYAYNFFPGTASQVVMHLQNGLYVTEIDDRGWQNTQPLLLGNNLRVLFENDVMYVERDGYYFELLTEIDSN